MKTLGARNKPVSRDPQPALAEAEMTPAMRSAVQSLLGEIEDLRGEVGRLKSRLSEVEGLADRDALTPLLNRRAFLRELQRMRALVQRYDTPASLVFFDLDGFKRVNDRFGHAAGDAAPQAVAERLTANVRESDVVGRLGGDEFGVILAQADLATAGGQAAALCQAVEAEPVPLGDLSARLRISYGVRQLTATAVPEQMLADADAEMFARKRSR